MTFEELRVKLQDLNIKELRFDLEDYIEFVVQTNSLDQVKGVLQIYFGREIKLDEVASQEAVQFVERYGGIRGDQTLYYSHFPGSTEYAMIWPWRDGSQASIKIAQCRSYRTS